MRTMRDAMRFTGEETELSVDIVGYQFPNAREYWDSNWLMVAGTVTRPKGSWRFTEPCLTTFELDRLAIWFDGVAVGRQDSEFSAFTEPSFEFRYVSELEPAIEVVLWHECAAPWLDAHAEINGGVTLRFLLSTNDPRQLAAAARRLLERFPVRGVA